MERDIEKARAQVDQEKKSIESLDRKIEDLEKEKSRYVSKVHDFETEANKLDTKRLEKTRELTRVEEQEKSKALKYQAANDNKNSSDMRRAA